MPGARPCRAQTVTLLATPEQAETLTLANADARIQLVLRNGSDQTIEKTPGHEIAELYGERSARKKTAEEPCTTAADRARWLWPRPRLRLLRRPIRSW